MPALLISSPPAALNPTWPDEADPNDARVAAASSASHVDPRTIQPDHALTESEFEGSVSWGDERLLVP